MHVLRSLHTLSSAVVVFELKISDTNISVAVKMRGMENISFLWFIRFALLKLERFSMSLGKRINEI